MSGQFETRLGYHVAAYLRRSFSYNFQLALTETYVFRSSDLLVNIFCGDCNSGSRYNIVQLINNTHSEEINVSTMEIQEKNRNSKSQHILGIRKKIDKKTRIEGNTRRPANQAKHQPFFCNFAY